MKLQHMQKVPCSKLSCFPNFRKIIFFFQTNRIIYHKECLKLLFYMPTNPTMEKKKKGIEQPQERSLMEKAPGGAYLAHYLQVKNSFVSCVP